MNRRTSLLLLAGAGAAAVTGGRFLQQQASARSSLMFGNGFPYDDFDNLPPTRIPIGDAQAVVAFAPGGLALPREKIFDWVRHAGTAVATFYGHFPVNSVRILVMPVGGPGVQGGTTWGYRGCAIRMLVGAEADIYQLHRDWMMTHEFVHTALPDVGYEYAWLSEGLAVYIEPIARVQAGFLTAESIWTDMVHDMPQGLPRSGKLSFDGTPSWGRTYWGGAIFCLLCDLEIRKRTGNRLGLQDAMRGVLAAGGNHEIDWSIGRILKTADKAVGVDVMHGIYERLHAEPERIDLAGLWTQLGIEPTDDGLRFHDDAPLAGARVAITRRPSTG